GKPKVRPSQPNTVQTCTVLAVRATGARTASVVAIPISGLSYGNLRGAGQNSAREVGWSTPSRHGSTPSRRARGRLSSPLGRGGQVRRERARDVELASGPG